MKYLVNERVARKEDPPTNNGLQFYTRNKHGQFELFPPVRKPIYRRLFLASMIALAIGVILTGVSIGEEAPVQKNYDVIAQNALLCDTEEQVREFLAAVKGLPVGSPIPNVEGCGYLQYPVPAEWEYVSVYDDETATATIIKAESVAFGVQYLYLEYKVKSRPSQGKGPIHNI